MPGIDDGRLILAAGALLASALLASLVAGRLRVPGLLLFLAVGMLVGSDGLGLIDFDDYELARDIGIVALALILFEGGLASGWDEIRPVIRPAIGLATVGTLVTAGITG
jgi:cell volume regulation protein A